jgi:hypothetical protein
MERRVSFTVNGTYRFSGNLRIEPGNVVPFLNLFETLKYSGERVIIDGPCYSACALVLSEIPRNHICVTSRAVLGLHAPRLVDQDGREYDAPAATRLP